MHIRFLLAAAVVAAASAQQPAQPSSAPSVPAALTIYDENFAVARTTIDLDLHPGLNEVSTSQVTTQLEPDSVVLRDPAAAALAKPSFRIVEQNYDAAVVTQDWLLNKYEGKTIQFALGNTLGPDGRVVSGNTIEGKIIRAPQPPPPYGNQYGVYQQSQPLIEVNGEMQFQLPGTPLFPATTDGLLLKPTLRWQIDSAKAQKLTAELAYITGGMNWEATYNVVTGGANGGWRSVHARRKGRCRWLGHHHQPHRRRFPPGSDQTHGRRRGQDSAAKLWRYDSAAPMMMDRSCLRQRPSHAKAIRRLPPLRPQPHRLA